MSPMNLPSTVRRDVSQIIMWPHVVFAAMYRQYRDAWTRRICPSVEKITEFWTELRGHPALDSPEVRARPDLMTKCIPVKIHGDGTPITGLGKAGSKLMDIWHWSSIIGDGSTRTMTFFIFAVYKCLLSTRFGYNTYSHFARRLAWSMRALWTGRWPAQDEFGRAYTDVCARYIDSMSTDTQSYHTIRIACSLQFHCSLQ